MNKYNRICPRCNARYLIAGCSVNDIEVERCAKCTNKVAKAQELGVTEKHYWRLKKSEREGLDANS